jgi:hypothetical protein
MGAGERRGSHSAVFKVRRLKAVMIEMVGRDAARETVRDAARQFDAVADPCFSLSARPAHGRLTFEDIKQFIVSRVHMITTRR